MSALPFSSRVGLLVLVACTSAHAAVITDWDFGAVPVTAAPDNTPAPTTGTGSASSLGMTNNYTYSTSPVTTGSVTSDDVLLESPSSDFGSAGVNGNGDVWRIRGPGTNNGTGTGNGWNNAAPEYSQGAQFLASTAGFTNIGLSFEWAATTQGVGNMQVQYTTNGTTWNNVGSVINATVDSSSGGGYQTDTINFAALGITSVNNDANFGVRLVSAFNSQLAGGTEYASATSVVGGSPVQYNNNSGNWRFADVQVDGTASPVPLPASAWLMLSGLGGFAGLVRRRKS